MRPKAADPILFALAPIISAATAFTAFAVVPFGAETTFFGLLDRPVPLQVADVNVAILWVFAVTSMGVYGIVLAGWSSNSKYSLLGALRSSAQMISYELSYGMALAAVLVLAGIDVHPRHRRRAIRRLPGCVPRWFIFIQPIGFFIFMTAGVAETNRAPFDFPEAEQELVAGYHTEYSSMSFAMFFLAEYINMVTVSAIATSLYLGGWNGPLLPDLAGVDLVSREGRFPSVLLRMDAVDAAALSLRSADGVWLEVPAAALGRSTCSRPPPECCTLGFNLILFYVFAAIAVGTTLLVVVQSNPVYSVLLLIGSFIGLAGLVRAARCAVRRGDPDHRVCRRDHGAVPVCRDAV